MWGHATVPKLEKVNFYSIIISEWEIMSSNLVVTRGLKIAEGILLAYVFHRCAVKPKGHLHSMSPLG